MTRLKNQVKFESGSAWSNWSLEHRYQTPLRMLYFSFFVPSLFDAYTQRIAIQFINGNEDGLGPKKICPVSKTAGLTTHQDTACISDQEKIMIQFVCFRFLVIIQFVC